MQNVEIIKVLMALVCKLEKIGTVWKLCFMLMQVFGRISVYVCKEREISLKTLSAIFRDYLFMWKDLALQKGRQLLHFWFLNYFPLTRFHIVNRVRAITP